MACIIVLVKKGRYLTSTLYHETYIGDDGKSAWGHSCASAPACDGRGGGTKGER